MLQEQNTKLNMVCLYLAISAAGPNHLTDFEGNQYKIVVKSPVLKRKMPWEFPNKNAELHLPWIMDGHSFDGVMR